VRSRGRRSRSTWWRARTRASNSAAPSHEKPASHHWFEPRRETELTPPPTCGRIAGSVAGESDVGAVVAVRDQVQHQLLGSDTRCPAQGAKSLARSRFGARLMAGDWRSRMGSVFLTCCLIHSLAQSTLASRLATLLLSVSLAVNSPSTSPTLLLLQRELIQRVVLSLQRRISWARLCRLCRCRSRQNSASSSSLKSVSALTV